MISRYQSDPAWLSWSVSYYLLCFARGLCTESYLNEQLRRILRDRELS